jgi:hypothetical protein
VCSALVRLSKNAATAALWPGGGKRGYMAEAAQNGNRRNLSMIPKSGYRFSEKIMLQQ